MNRVKLGNPVKLSGNLVGIGDEHRRIARPPRRNSNRDIRSGYVLDGADHFKDGVSPVGASKVIRDTTVAQIAEYLHMRASDVGHMNEVADAGPIDGGVIVSVKLEIGAFLRCNLQQNRNQM